MRKSQMVSFCKSEKKNEEEEIPIFAQSSLYANYARA